MLSNSGMKASRFQNINSSNLHNRTKLQVNNIVNCSSES